MAVHPINLQFGMAIYNFIRGKKTGIINNYKAPEVQFVSLLRLPGVKQNQTKRFSMSLTLKKIMGKTENFHRFFSPSTSQNLALLVDDCCEPRGLY